MNSIISSAKNNLLTALIVSIALILAACDSSGDDDSTDSTETGSNNNAPVFISSGSVSVPENTSNSFYTAEASDDDGDALTYSISGGIDKDLFVISASGALRFSDAPDYEIPQDDSSDNDYTLELSANDGEGGHTNLPLTVSVSDVSAPSAPSNLQAEAGDSSVDLTWDAVNDAETYHVYAAEVAGVTASNYSELDGGMAFTNLTSNSYTSANLTNSTTYYFVVVASSTEGNSSASAEVSSTPITTANPTSDELTLALDLSSSDYASLMVTEELAEVEQQDAQGMVQSAGSKLSFANSSSSLQAQNTDTSSNSANFFALDDEDNVHSVFTNSGIYVLYVANDPTGEYAYVALDIDQSAEFIKLSQCALYRVKLATNEVFCVEQNYAPANLDSSFTAALEYQGLKPVQFVTSDDSTTATTTLSTVYYLGRSFTVSDDQISWDSSSNPLIRKLDIASDGSVSNATPISFDIDSIKSFALLADGLLVYHFSNELSAGLKLYDNGSTNTITDIADSADSDYFYSAGDTSDVLMYGKVDDSERIMRFMRSAEGGGVNIKELPSAMINGESTVRVISADDGFVYALTHDETAQELNFYQLMPFDDTPMFSIDVSSSNLAQALDNKVQLYINHAYYVDTESHEGGNHNDRDVIKIVKKYNGETRTLLNDEAWTQRYDIHKWKQIGDEIHFAGVDYSISKMVYGRVDLTAVENNAADSEILSVSEISSVLGVSSDILDLEDIRPDAPNKYEAGSPKLEFHTDERNPYAATIEFTKYMNKTDVESKTTIDSSSSATTDHFYVWYYKTLHIIYDQDGSTALTDSLADGTEVTITLADSARDLTGFYLANGMESEELTILYSIDSSANNFPVAVIEGVDYELSGYVAAAGSKLELSAQSSYDPDQDDQLSYQWSVTPQSYGSFSDPFAATTTLNIDPYATESVEISLQVCDLHNDCDTDSITVAISSDTTVDPSLPDTPENFAASLVDDNSVSLTWDESDNATGYRIYRNGSIIADKSESSHIDQDLAYDQVYTYKVSAYNSYGESSPTEEASISTLLLPDTPANFTAIPGDQSVSLSWQQVSNATSYLIYRDSQEIAEVEQGSDSYTDSASEANAISNDTAYSYQISAVNTAGESELSAEVVVIPTAKPSAPTNFSVLPKDAQAELSWDAVANATGYKLYRNNSLHEDFNFDVTEHTDDGLINNQVYSYRLSAYNFSGESALTEAITVTPIGAPATPSQLTATAGDQQVSLQWSASSNASGYYIYKDQQLIHTADASASTYTDANVDNDTTYSYQISAFNSSGESQLSDAVSATPRAKPPFPDNFSATVDDGSVTLQWSLVATAEGYKLYRDNQEIADLAATTQQYLDAGLINGTTHSYQIASYSSFGTGELSAIVQATPIAPPTTPNNFKATAGDAVVNLSWDQVLYAASYNIYRNSSLLTTTDNLTYEDTAVFNGSTYQYSVSAINSVAESALSVVVEATPKLAIPATPQNFSGTAGDQEVLLVWDLSAKASGYNIYRNGQLRQELDSATQASYSDTGLSNAVSYQYQITAFNSSGESAPTSALELTPVIISTPDNLTAVAAPGVINLSWDIVAGADSYDLYRYTNSGCAHLPDNYTSCDDDYYWPSLTAAANSSSTDSATFILEDSAAIVSNETYFYRVLAANSVSSSQLSAELEVLSAIALNDSGITWSGIYEYGNNSSCSSSTNIDAPQDCDQGRDNDNNLGFQLEKLDFSGQALAEQTNSWSDSGTETDSTQWSCVRDSVTGLVWEVKNDKGTVLNNVHDKDDTYRWGGITADSGGEDNYPDWDDLVNTTNSEQLCGYSDWRVPSIDELRSIINYDRSSPSIKTHYFPNNRADDRYWTADVKLSTPATQAVAIDFTYGEDEFRDRDEYNYVRLVRGTKRLAVDDDRYQDLGDGNILDKTTHLVWRQCSEGMSYDSSSQSCTGIPNTFNWHDALVQADLVTHGIYSDWRVPNIKELASIIEHDRQSPAVHDIFASGVVDSYYFSSSPHLRYTSCYYTTSRSYGILFSSGVDAQLCRTSSDYYLILVRDYYAD